MMRMNLHARLRKIENNLPPVKKWAEFSCSIEKDLVVYKGIFFTYAEFVTLFPNSTLINIDLETFLKQAKRYFAIRKLQKALRPKPKTFFFGTPEEYEEYLSQNDKK